MNDLDLLQGTWTQTGFEENGVLNPPDTHGAPGATTTITGTRFTVTAPDGHVILSGRFELDPTTTPKSVTWIDDFGPDAGRRLPASYSLTRTRFTFIAGNEGAPRPTIFRTGPGQTLRSFARPLPTPTLHTPRLTLRPFTPAEAAPLFALHSNRRVLRYWDSPPWTHPHQADAFLARCRQMEQEGSGARVVLERTADGAFLGWTALMHHNPTHRSAKLGYCLAEAAWGQGYATEAARALLAWGFPTLDLNRVQSDVDTRNPPSRRVLEKLGFVHEGTLRQDCIVDGEISDSWMFGLLRQEWRP